MYVTARLEMLRSPCVCGCHAAAAVLETGSWFLASADSSVAPLLPAYNLQAFLAASGSQLAAMNLQDLSNVLAAVSGLKLLPDQQWVDDLCR